jgi:dynein-related subfamily AAA family protein
MRPQAVSQALKTLVSIKRPVMLWGQPGIGKSDLVRQDAASRGKDYGFIDLRLSQLDPVDMRGIPYHDLKKKVTNWATPHFLPQDGEGTLFLDEINSAPQATMAAGYQLVLDRRLGDYVLPEGWAIIAAGNNTGDRAIVNQMSTALRNRFVHIDVEVNVDDWHQWALINGIRPEILAFLRFRPNLLNVFDLQHTNNKEGKKAQQTDKAFATPRSWKFVNDIINSEHKQSNAIEFDLIKGAIGEGPAGEYIAYQRFYKDVPDLDALLLSPKTAIIPEEPATLYAVSTGLAAKITKDNIAKAIIYIGRMPKEFQVLTIKDAIIRDKEISNTKAFEKWGIANADILIG